MKTPERVELARELRADGLKYREIAEQLGVSFQTVHSWVTDPDGAALRARKDSYAASCVDCGAQTSGWNGRRETPRCLPCHNERTKAQSRRWILESFAEWHALFGEPPSATDWNPAFARLKNCRKSLARHESTGRPWPGPQLVIAHFGSWNAGVRAAGFEPRKVGYYRDESKRREILRAAFGTEERRARIADLYRQGLTYREIGEQMGVTVPAITAHIRKMRRDGWDLPYRTRGAA